MARRQKPDGRRIKLYLGLIRQVRGKSLLEALHRLQSGVCAYDSKPCVLLLPQATNMISDRSLLPVFIKTRFATIDHVVPRHLGGLNLFPNLVMASAQRNNEKGCLAPLNRWVPEFRHTNDEVARMIKVVDETRYLQASALAEDRRLSRQDVIDKLILRELRSPTEREFKFYSDPLPLVA